MTILAPKTGACVTVAGREFSRAVKLGRRISRWFFVLITWLITVIFIRDSWALFQSFTVSVFLESSLPVILGVLVVLSLILLVLMRSAWLLRLVICMIFFLSIAVLYSYVGYELSRRFQIAENSAGKEVRNSMK